MRVVLIGAGVAGGVIARGLARMAGLDVELVEQVAPEDHAMAGNGLNVGPNALWALEHTLPEVAAELRAASLPWTRWHAALSDGTPLYEIRLADVAPCPGIRIRWSELYRVARQRVAPRTRYDRRCVGVDFAADGTASVALERTADGGREEIRGIDLLIAGDGRYSRLRETLCGAPSIRHLGVANFRLLIEDGGAIDIDDLEQWYTGPNRLLAFRLADRRIYLSGNFPIEAGRDIRDDEKTPEFLRRIYLPGSGPVEAKCRRLIDAACDPRAVLHWSRAQEIDVRFHDAQHRVLFVGDAAHAMAPTLGQGATQAIEDACALVDLFERMRGPGFGVPDFLDAYDRLRRERIEFVRRFSWDASESLLAGRDPIATNRPKAGTAYRQMLRRMYGDLGFGPPAAVSA
ncbi:MAG TPA: NAD(P)/FAD-dependent oxidoreductase [Alphaproteobacteria bacterium]|nr:NAD(P)/FAD-dependent oxidoreductase [Alphaproteobacteria bacterium]